MTDTIRELINRVLDYVERTPGAHFEIARWKEGVVESYESQLHVDFYIIDKNGYSDIDRDGDYCWQIATELTEDNLRYLVEQLEGME